MDNFSFSEPNQRVDDGRVGRKLEQVFVDSACFLFRSHVFGKIRDRIAHGADVGGRPGSSESIGLKQIIPSLREVAVHARCPQLFDRRALHQLMDHRRDHFHVREFLGSDVGKEGFAVVIRHRVSLDLVA